MSRNDDSVPAEMSRPTLNAHLVWTLNLRPLCVDGDQKWLQTTAVAIELWLLPVLKSAPSSFVWLI